MNQWGLGIAGWGSAGAQMAIAADLHGEVRLAGIAEPDPSRRRDAALAGVPLYADLGEMVSAPDVDVVYLATPTPKHREHVDAAVAAGKHVIVEKPMAASVADAIASCEAARAAGLVLIVGSTHSFNAPVRLLRSLVASGNLGALVAVHSFCRTDWLDRPRSPSDLSVGEGGGLVMRQGAHQIDILRYVVGSPARSVFGTTIGASKGRELGYSAIIQFDGVTASASYAGVGGFDSRLLTLGVGELAETRQFDPPLRDYFVQTNSDRTASPMFGQCVVTFEHGEAVSTPYGALVFEHGAAREISMPPAWNSGWLAVLDEMASTLRGNPAIHDGNWGLATLEICAAVHVSSENGVPVRLHHQQASVLHASPTQRTSQ